MNMTMKRKMRGNALLTGTALISWKKVLSTFWVFLIIRGGSTLQHTSDLSDIFGLNRQNFLFYMCSQYVWMKYLSNT